MSKLAHSNETTMNQIDRERCIRDGNEDLLPERHLRFGGLVAPIAEQLGRVAETEEQKTTQTLADAITQLYVFEMLTDREMHRARIRLMHYMKEAYAL